MKQTLLPVLSLEKKREYMSLTRGVAPGLRSQHNSTATQGPAFEGCCYGPGEPHVTRSQPQLTTGTKSDTRSATHPSTQQGRRQAREHIKGEIPLWVAAATHGALRNTQ